MLEEKCKPPLRIVRTNEWDRWNWSMSSRKVSREKGRRLRVSAPGSLGWIDASLARYEILIRSDLDHLRNI